MGKARARRNPATRKSEAMNRREARLPNCGRPAHPTRPSIPMRQVHMQQHEKRKVGRPLGHSDTPSKIAAGEPEANDEVQGQWPEATLLEMDQAFRLAYLGA